MKCPHALYVKNKGVRKYSDLKGSTAAECHEEPLVHYASRQKGKSYYLFRDEFSS